MVGPVDAVGALKDAPYSCCVQAVSVHSTDLRNLLIKTC